MPPACRSESSKSIDAGDADALVWNAFNQPDLHLEQRGRTDGIPTAVGHSRCGLNKLVQLRRNHGYFGHGLDSSCRRHGVCHALATHQRNVAGHSIHIYRTLRNGQSSAAFVTTMWCARPVPRHKDAHEKIGAEDLYPGLRRSLAMPSAAGAGVTCSRLKSRGADAILIPL